MPVDFSAGTERTIPLLSKIINKAKTKNITLLNLFNYDCQADDQNSIAISVKEKIEEEFGLHVQVFRASTNNVWLQTIATDD